MIKASPNDTLTSSFTVTNLYDGDVTVDVITQDWHSYEGNGKLDINSWLIMSPTKLTLAKGETKYVTFTVKTNKSMKGSISGQVTFSLRPPGNNVLVVKMSFPIYLTIDGTEKVSYSINTVAFNKSDNNNILAIFSVKNDGNVHIRPTGNIKVYDSNNKAVYIGEIPESYPVYADSTRGGLIAAIPVSVLQPGKYTVEINLNMLGKSATKKAQFRLEKDGTIVQ